MSDNVDIPRVFNLLPLLSGGKANRTTPIGRFEIPQRFWRPIAIGTVAGVVAIGLDGAFGSLIVSWWFPIVLAVTIGVLRWRARGNSDAAAIRFWTAVAAVAWLMFPTARLIGWFAGFAPIIGGWVGALGWPILGASLMVLSSEARTRSGANRADAVLSAGRSTNVASQLHLGLWPVPTVPTDVRWCDGAVPNPNRQPVTGGR